MSEKTTYDVIVVGAGASGVIAATELARVGVRVALIEAGPWRSLPTKDGIVSWTPEQSTSWHADAIELLNPTLVGGKSAVQGGIGIRGYGSDFDAWADAIGMSVWGRQTFAAAYAELLKQDSPLELSLFNRRIDEFGDIGIAFQQAAELMGLHAKEDFDEQFRPGYGVLPLLLRQGKRVNVADILSDELHNLPDLSILASARVVTVNSRNMGVTGVTVLRPNGQADEIKGRRVLLCAGSLSTASLLMQSGIGPAGTVADRQDGFVNSPAVGMNVRDHFSRWTTLRAPDDIGSPRGHAPFGLAAAVGVDGAEFRLEGFTVSAREGRRLVLSTTLYSPASTGVIRSIRERTISFSLHRDALALGVADTIARNFARAPSLTAGLGNNPHVVHDRKIRSAHHVHGGVGMSNKIETGAVNSNLEVFGRERLYVGDVSIVPTLFRNNTHLLALAIGYMSARSIVEALGDRE